MSIIAVLWILLYEEWNDSAVNIVIFVGLLLLLLVMIAVFFLVRFLFQQNAWFKTVLATSKNERPLVYVLVHIAMIIISAGLLFLMYEINKLLTP